MAKKFVRGITDVKTINNQDFDTNNVNDLLSDGQYNYIHRKKGKTEEYHNLTDNIKTISSDNTDLLTVTNNNKTTNTALLSPKHDAKKEQVLESTRDTITINHGTNGTPEKTTVDTNPQKVLEHENLLTDYGISKKTTGNTTKLGLEFTRVENNFDLNNFKNGRVRAAKFLNAPQENTWFFVSAYSEGDFTIQEAIALADDKNTTYRRLKTDNGWCAWREQVGDKSVIDSSTIQRLDNPGDPFTAIKHVVTSGQQKLTTFVFQCREAESVLTADLKQQLEDYLPTNKTISNGAVTITNDGTTMKLINSAPSENISQQGTFTFHEYTSGGELPPAS